MSHQVFISYRRDGGDVTAKLICEALKNHGSTVFYDYDSISGGFFDEKILKSIEECNDFVLVLPPNALDRCIDSDDWVRAEISCALTHQKPIIPIMLPGFEFPDNLPDDIADVARINAVHFFMAYFEGVINTITDRLTSKPSQTVISTENANLTSKGLAFSFQEELNGYSVAIGNCADSEILVPDTYNGKAVVSIAEEGFRDCSALKTIYLPKTIKTIGEHAFHGCSLLENINIPNNVTNIEGWAFYKCSSIRNVVIPQNVKNIGQRAFTDCTSLLSFKVDKGNGYYCDHDDHLYTKNMCTLVAYACANQNRSYVVPNGVTKIEDCAFSCCSALTNIILPDSVTHVEKFAFSECVNLESITLPHCATSIEDFVFKHCSSLSSVTIPEGVQTIGEGAFRDCTSLKTVVLPKTIKIIKNSAFNGCSLLENINIPNSVTDIDKWAFYGCSSLKSILIPKCVKSIGARAFANCTMLKKIDVSIFNRYYRSTKNALFSKDMKKMLAYAIGCEDSSYTIPNCVTTIEDSAFSHSKVESITIPNNVTDIGEYSFYECKKLKSINFNGTIETYKKINVKNNNFNKTKTQQICCTDGNIKI